MKDLIVPLVMFILLIVAFSILIGRVDWRKEIVEAGKEVKTIIKEINAEE